MSVGLNSKLKDEKKEEELKDEQELDAAPRVGPNVKSMIVIGIGAVLVLAVVLFFFSCGNDKGENPSSQAVTSSVPVTADPDANEEGIIDTEGTENDVNDDLANNEDSFVQGDPSYDDSNNNTTSGKVFDENDYVKDLKGADVSAVYSVSSRNYIKTHVSYTAKRAIIDDGMEMYWLDVVYKKKKYRVQVPFYYFKDLDDEGICRVEIEVLNLEGGGQIISYMQVVDESNTSDEN